MKLCYYYKYTTSKIHQVFTSYAYKWSVFPLLLLLHRLTLINFEKMAKFLSFKFFLVKNVPQISAKTKQSTAKYVQKIPQNWPVFTYCFSAKFVPKISTNISEKPAKPFPQPIRSPVEDCQRFSYLIRSFANI